MNKYIDCLRHCYQNVVMPPLCGPTAMPVRAQRSRVVAVISTAQRPNNIVQATYFDSKIIAQPSVLTKKASNFWIKTTCAHDRWKYLRNTKNKKLLSGRKRRVFGGIHPHRRNHSSPKIDDPRSMTQDR
jgi:hypothetical protein